MRTPIVETDERTAAVEHAAGHLAYRVLCWLLVIDLGIKGFKPDWTQVNGFPLDLAAMLFGGAAVNAWATWRGQAVSRTGVRSVLAAVVLATAVAFLIVRLVLSR